MKARGFAPLARINALRRCQPLRILGLTRVNAKANKGPDTSAPTLPPPVPPVLEVRETGFERDRMTRELRLLTSVVFVGLSSGVSITLFKLLVEGLQHATYGSLVGHGLPATVPLNAIFEGTADSKRLLAAVVPAAGGLIVTMLRLLAGGFGGGLGDFATQIERQTPFAFKKQIMKLLACVATLGTGNSLGPEGPAVEIGATVARLGSAGSPPGRDLDRQRRLLLAGTAAGVAAGFNAPIAGVFFALECTQEYLPNIGPRLRTSIASVLLCSVVSALTADVLLHEELALKTAETTLAFTPQQLPLFLGLGFFSGVVALLFKQMLAIAPKAYDKKRGPLRFIPPALRPLFFGLFCGGVGLLCPQILFFGYETLDGIIRTGGGDSSPIALLGLLALKSFMTAGSLASGLVGGTFAPSLFLGAALGAAYHKLALAALLPIGFGPLLGDGPAFAMVGAASVLAALFRAPLTAILLLFELTRDYNVVVVAAASAGLAGLISEVWRQREEIGRIKSEQEPVGDMGVSLFETPGAELLEIQVSDVMAQSPLVLGRDETLAECARKFEETGAYHALVVMETVTPSEADVEDKGVGELVGLLSLGDVLRALDMDAMTVASDAVTPLRELVIIREHESAFVAKNLMQSNSVDALPVLRRGSKTAIGLVNAQSIVVGRMLNNMGSVRKG